MKSQTPLLNLYCNEDISSLSATSTEKDESLDFYSVSESDCDYIEMSLSKETNFWLDPDKYQVKKLSKSTRLEALKWVLQTRVLFGYHYRTAYLSLLYYDRFLAKKWFSDEKPWTGRILSIACLSLAAKMEEQKARPFAEYRVEGYNFEGIAIQRMELCVLSTLGWKMVVITPFTYLNYFVIKFCVEKSRQQESVITEASDFILAIMGEINVAEIRPSIVAAASVLAAYDRHRNRTMLDNKIDAVPTWGPEEKEQIMSCYCLLQEILMLKTPKSIIPSWNTHGAGGSKRRLNFDDNDQHCPVKKNFLP